MGKGEFICRGCGRLFRRTRHNRWVCKRCKKDGVPDRFIFLGKFRLILLDELDESENKEGGEYSRIISKYTVNEENNIYCQLWWEDMEKLLTSKEKKVIQLLKDGWKEVDIAKMRKVSQQDISILKGRAIKKIREAIKKHLFNF